MPENRWTTNLNIYYPYDIQPHFFERTIGRFDILLSELLDERDGTVIVNATDIDGRPAFRGLELVGLGAEEKDARQDAIRIARTALDAALAEFFPHMDSADFEISCIDICRGGARTTMAYDYGAEIIPFKRPEG